MPIRKDDLTGKKIANLLQKPWFITKKLLTMGISKKFAVFRQVTVLKVGKGGIRAKIPFCKILGRS
ncbi:MAG: hypothetical protein HC763_23475 [Hydrococcus sp. CRU_1_1]|nr:hypothetical protein [Hydrococcus sp. CRU_1_1]